MVERIEIVKQVKLTAAQRIALVAASNAGGVLHNVDYDVREMLRYLGLIEEKLLYSRAEIDKEVAEAWTDLRAAVRDKDISKADGAVSTLRDQRWKREKKCWRLTAAADEYLLKGRVVVTVGVRNETETRARLRA